VLTQCTPTVGGYLCVNNQTTKERYVGIYEDRATTEQQAFVDLFVEFVAEDTVEVTLGTAKTTVSVLKGNEVDVSAIEIPTGKRLAGFATTEGATETQIVGTVLNYKAVIDLATDGTVTLYPVFEDASIKYDLIVAVWGNNPKSDAPYVTTEELAKIEADFRVYLAEKGIADATLRFDYIDGGTSAYAESIAADVMVVLSGKNVLTQCVSTTGGYKCVNIETSSQRYVGVYQDRISTESQNIVNLFVEFVSGVTAE
ncbi:MAG: hypothetical protein IJY13_01345, partial [Clostridia bacterium]|nr:hypothetical protein [Clostridia bacterium]